MASKLGSYSVVFWNARALLCMDGRLRRKKLDELRIVARRPGVIAIGLQEVHGDALQLARASYYLRKDFIVYFSARPPGPDLPGQRRVSMAILFPKFKFAGQVRCHVTAPSPGRAMRASIQVGEQCWTMWNLHNHALTRPQVLELIHAIGLDRDAVHHNPRHNFLIVGGDTNLLAPGGHMRSISRPSGTPPPQSDQRRPFAHLFQQLFDTLTEIDCGLETHFDGRDKLSGIDRIFVATPGWLLLQLHCQFQVLSDPLDLHGRGISDHAPIAFVCCHKFPVPSQHRPIPKFVFALPRFPNALENLIAAEGPAFHRLSVPAKHLRFKVLIREAARVARDEHFAIGSKDDASKLTLMKSLARAIWLQDRKLATVILSLHPWAHEFVKVSSSKVEVKDYAWYDAQFSATLLKARTGQASKTVSRDTSDVRRRRIAEQQRKLWVPFGRRLQVLGVKEAGKIHTLEADMNDALARHWEPTFTKETPIPTEMAQRIANVFSSRLEFPGYHPPSSSCIGAFLRRAKGSAPGTDGIPYYGWFRTGQLGWSHLHNVGVWMHKGLSMFQNFNDALHVFPPKGKESADTEEGVFRAPENTRPIGLKNTDVKALCASSYNLFKMRLAHLTIPIQRGFTPSRGFGQNIVHLDTVARKYSMMVDDNADVSCWPFLLFTDFGSAFPSLGREWLWITVAASGMPIGLQNFVKGIYYGAKALGRVGPRCQILFAILSGTIQGCPLAAFLFTVGFEPFLKLLDRKLSPQRGELAACADDVGLVCRALKHLRYIRRIYDIAELVAGLTIKIQKTHLVPLVRWTPGVAALVQDWLRSHHEAWAGIDVTPAAVYLGVWLGTAANGHHWHEQRTKWINRATALAAVEAYPTVATFAYNTHALSTLGYLAQFTLPSASVFNREHFVLSKLIRLPPNSLAAKDFQSFRHWGAKMPSSVRAYCLATIIRASLVTLPWQEDRAALIAAADEWLPLVRGMQGRTSPDFWDGPALVESLYAAANGFPGLSSFRGLRDIIQKTRKAHNDHIVAQNGTTKRRPKFKWQGTLYTLIVDHLYPDQVLDLFPTAPQSI